MSPPKWISHWFSRGLPSTFDLMQTVAQLSTGKYLPRHPMMAGTLVWADGGGHDLGTQLQLQDTRVRIGACPIRYWCSVFLYPTVSRADERMQRTNCATICTRGLLDCRTALSALAAANPKPSLHLVTLRGDSSGTPWCPCATGLGTQLLFSNRHMEGKPSFSILRSNLGSHLAKSSV